MQIREECDKTGTFWSLCVCFSLCLSNFTLHFWPPLTWNHKGKGILANGVSSMTILMTEPSSTLPSLLPCWPCCTPAHHSWWSDAKTPGFDNLPCHTVLCLVDVPVYYFTFTFWENQAVHDKERKCMYCLELFPFIIHLCECLSFSRVYGQGSVTLYLLSLTL